MESQKEILKKFSPKKIWLPIGIGLAVAFFLFYRSYDKEAFQNFEWSAQAIEWLSVGVLMLAVRDVAYMIRLRVVTRKELSWKQCFESVMLWEFASALAPPFLGGGFGFAIYIVHREGLRLGKSISAIMLTTFFDGLFFAILAPLVFIYPGKAALFNVVGINGVEQMAGTNGIIISFWTIYTIVMAYKVLIAYAIFINAKPIKSLIVGFFSLPFFNKWKQGAIETGNDLILTSTEFKSEKKSFWINAIAATFLSWSARFILVNCIISAFTSKDLNQVLIFSRQVIMGILNMGTPTPGGSGIAEVMFSNFLGEFISNAGLAAALALLWRLLSYYPYLFVGAVLLPKWIKQKF